MKRLLCALIIGFFVSAQSISYKDVHLLIKFGIPEDINKPLFYRSYIKDKEIRCFCGKIPTIFAVGIIDIYGFCPDHAEVVIERLKKSKKN